MELKSILIYNTSMLHEYILEFFLLFGCALGIFLAYAGWKDRRVLEEAIRRFSDDESVHEELPEPIYIYRVFMGRESNSNYVDVIGTRAEYKGGLLTVFMGDDDSHHFRGFIEYYHSGPYKTHWDVYKNAPSALKLVLLKNHAKNYN